MKKYFYVIMCAAILAGCQNMSDTQGRTQSKIDVVGVSQTFEWYSKRQTKLRIEYLDPNTTEKRRKEIEAQSQVEREMWEAAVGVVAKIRPVVEIRIVSEIGTAAVTQ